MLFADVFKISRFKMASHRTKNVTTTKEEYSESNSDSDSEDVEESGSESEDVEESGSEEDNIDPVQQRMAQIRKELSEVPFEELQKLKDKLGTKIYKEAMLGKNKNSKEEKHKKFKRVNKNRPMEMSSKRPVSRHKDVIPVKKQVRRDPRFDDLSGQYQEEVFEKGYSFLGDVRKRDKETVEKAYKDADTEKSKHKLKSLLQRMEDQEKTVKSKQQKRKREQDFKREMKDLTKDGQKPYFLKKSDKKKLELAEKFKELKKKDQLDKYMAKKRKRNAQKDKKHLPQK